MRGNGLRDRANACIQLFLFQDTMANYGLILAGNMA